MKPLKVLFAGIGSIGTRHLRNFSALCAAQGVDVEVTALRSSPRALPPEVSALLCSEVSVLPKNETYDVAFITNPTHVHADVLADLKGRVQTFFIEKPIFESIDYSLEALGLGTTQKAYVAAPMRWCGVYMALKKHLIGMPVYSVRAICSSYLPEWRPSVDYRENYSAHRNMGGGVALDLIHEWDYLVDLFGSPQQAVGMSGTFSHLEINSDDLAVYIAKYADFLCELHLDYFGREYRRSVEILSKEGMLAANFGTGVLTLPDGTVEDHAEPVARRYEREMEYFLRYAQAGEAQSINSPQKAMQVLKLAHTGSIWQ